MSSQFSDSLLIECRPSRRLALLYVFLFAGAMLGALLPDLPVLLECALAALLAVAGVRVLRRTVLLSSPDSVVALRPSSGQWTVYTRDGNSRQARLISAAFWVCGIICLAYKDAGGKHFSVLLAPDPAQFESLRALRAWIRHRLGAA